MAFGANPGNLRAAVEAQLQPQSGPTTVANYMEGGMPEGCIYIGRKMPRYALEASIWANPYRLKDESEREAILTQFRAYLLNSPHLLMRLPELRGKTLVCWCCPKPCHGDVLAEMAHSFCPRRYIEQRIGCSETGLLRWMQDNLACRYAWPRKLEDITETTWFASLAAFTGEIKPVR